MRVLISEGTYDTGKFPGLGMEIKILCDWITGKQKPRCTNVEVEFFFTYLPLLGKKITIVQSSKGMSMAMVDVFSGIRYTGNGNTTLFFGYDYKVVKGTWRKMISFNTAVTRKRVSIRLSNIDSHLVDTTMFADGRMMKVIV